MVFDLKETADCDAVQWAVCRGGVPDDRQVGSGAATLWAAVSFQKIEARYVWGRPARDPTRPGASYTAFAGILVVVSWAKPPPAAGGGSTEPLNEN